MPDPEPPPDEEPTSPRLRTGPPADTSSVPESAVVFDRKGLYLIDVATGDKSTPFSGQVHACLSHPAADAVWFVATPEGATDSRLWVVDLRRDTAAFALAEDVPPQIRAIAVHSWKGGIVRSAIESEFEVGMMIDLRSVPVTHSWIGCQSPAFDCYEDPTTETLREPLAKLATAVENVKLTDPGVAKRIADRAPPSRPPSLGGRTPKVEVPYEACREEPNDCGRARAIPGMDLQLVVTANERGDRFHEWLSLYDPAAKVFMPLTDPTKTSPTPTGKGTEITRMYVAASGSAYGLDDRIVHRQRGALVQQVSVCGFTSLGAVLTGVTK